MGITNSRPTAAFLAELAAAGSVDLIIHAGEEEEEEGASTPSNALLLPPLSLPSHSSSLPLS